MISGPELWMFFWLHASWHEHPALSMQRDTSSKSSEPKFIVLEYFALRFVCWATGVSKNTNINTDNSQLNIHPADTQIILMLRNVTATENPCSHHSHTSYPPDSPSIQQAYKSTKLPILNELVQHKENIPMLEQFSPVSSECIFCLYILPKFS